MEVGVGVQEELVAVVGDGVVVGLRLDAAGKRRLFPPGQRLLGVARPRLHLRGVGTPVALVVDERHAGLDAGLVGLGQIDRRSHVAGGLDDGQALEHAHRGAGLERGVDGGKARFARAHDHHVVLVRLGEPRDVGRLLQEAGAFVGGAVAGGVAFACVARSLRRATRKRRRARQAESADAAELEQVATRNVHSSHDGFPSLAWFSDCRTAAHAAAAARGLAVLHCHHARPPETTHRPCGEKRFKCINPSINRCLNRRYASNARHLGSGKGVLDELLGEGDKAAGCSTGPQAPSRTGSRKRRR